MKSLFRLFTTLVLILFVHLLIGQQNLSPFFGQAQGSGNVVLGTARYPGLPNHNPIESKLFKAESVMKHQRALDLSENQKNKILSDYQQAQSDFTKWQWELQAATEELTEMVSQEQIDEAATLKQLEKMLDLERNIKRTQLGLMISIKNQLTPEQQKKLRELENPYGSLFHGQGQYNEALRLYNSQNKAKIKGLWDKEKSKNEE